jgi:cation-transporting ATPase 13A1
MYLSLTNKFRGAVTVDSPEIERAHLHASIPKWRYHYIQFFLPLYPLLVYAYYFKYDEWIKSEEWTFVFCVALGAGNALAFLATRWSTAFLAWETYKSVSSIQEADSIRVVPKEHKGKGDIVRINKKDVRSQISFIVT